MKQNISVDEFYEEISKYPMKISKAPVDAKKYKQKLCVYYQTCKKQERYKPHCSVKGIHKCYTVNK